MTCPDGYSCTFIVAQAWSAEQSFWFSIFITAIIVLAVFGFAYVLWRALR